jgi:hypothetical protein
MKNWSEMFPEERLLDDCPYCGGQISVPLFKITFKCQECGVELVQTVSDPPDEYLILS